ncbi:MAG: hypothetical protein PHC92_06940, partial [Syntrophomonadaceae bacterium]|nr:hypothetical protein [Syntrophomonadaceae bacterium]
AVPGFLVEKEVSAADFAHYEKQSRIKIKHMNADQRRRNFAPVSYLLTEEEAIKEAKRCLECGCADYFECKLIQYAGDYGVQPQRLKGTKHPQLSAEDHPFIIRDMDKCILCGLCVRICDEVMGTTALGLVNRGFETVIQPELGVSLKESDCICCGQCVALCPTGALTERNSIHKNVPMLLTESHTNCAQCSLGCGQLVKSRGDMIVKIEPDEGELLCYRGRFGWEAIEEEPIRAAMLKDNNVLKNASLAEAIKKAGSSLNDIRQRFGSSSLAVFASPDLTGEEACAAVQIAETLGTDKMSSFSFELGERMRQIIMEQVLTGKWETLCQSDLILMIGSFDHAQIAAVRARQAARAGTRLVIISPQSTLADDLASIKIPLKQNNTVILEQLLQAVKDKIITEKNHNMPDSEETSRQESFDCLREFKEFAELYVQAKKTTILLDGYSLNPAAMEIVAELLSESIDPLSAERKLLLVHPGAYITGLWIAGFTKSKSQLGEEIKGSKIKGLLIIDEDPLGAGILSKADLEECELLVVLTSFMTPTAELADVVLPLASPLEANLQQLKASIADSVQNHIAETTEDKHLGDSNFADCKADRELLFIELPLTDYKSRIFEEKMRNEGLNR